MASAPAATGAAAAAVVEEVAPAKVNLALHVTGRRADGYHLLDSLVVFARPPAADVVRLVPGRPGLAATGPFAHALPAAGDNIAARAVAAVLGPQTAASVGIEIEKHLPVAAGIGGGSADAAAALRAAIRLSPDGAPADLAGIALALGADVPVCLAGRPARMAGIGERVAPLAAGALPPLPLVLANPGVPVATADVFRALVRRDNAPLPPVPPRFAGPDAVAAFLAATRNDLEAPARAVAPPIDAALAALSAAGASLARLSGSGATCFGLFADRAGAEAAARRIARERPDWWVVATETGPA